MTLTQLAFVLSTLTVVVVYWISLNGQRQRRNLPPGPKKYPLIGNLLSMPNTLEWETFAKWGQEYSPWWIKGLWFSTQHSSNSLCRFRYYPCQRFGDINDYLKLVRSRYRHSRPKIQHLLEQVSRCKYPLPGKFTEIFLCFNQTTLYHAPRIVSYLYVTLKSMELIWS